MIDDSSDDAPDPDITMPLDELIERIVPDPKIWRKTPNALLGGKTPNELIEAEQSNIIRDLLRAAKLGMPS